MFKFIIFVLLFATFGFSQSVLSVSKKKQNKKRTSIQKKTFSPLAGGEDEQQKSTAVNTPYSSSEPIKSTSALSPGVPVGNTWYDYQHNGSMGRMIDWGPHSGGSGDAIVHFGWMRLPGAALDNRHYAYNYYNASTGVLGTTIEVLPYDDEGGYVNLQSTANSIPVIGGYRKTGLFGSNQTHLYWDVLSGFGVNSVLTDSVASYGSNPGKRALWPKFAYQEGTDTVTHVIATVIYDPINSAIFYFRKVGSDSIGSWDYPPYIIDTIDAISHDIVASRISDKVVIAWTANLNYDSNGDQYPVGVCDTCSGYSPYAVQWDNDVYFQTSDDQGQTWNPRINVTKYRLGEAGFRAYTDISTLIDSNDDFHVLWNAVPWFPILLI